jgi:hypothetical protein
VSVWNKLTRLQQHIKSLCPAKKNAFFIRAGQHLEKGFGASAIIYWRYAKFGG